MTDEVESHPLKDRLVKASTIEHYLDCSHGYVYKLIADPDCPEAIRLSADAVRFDGNQVLAFLERRVAQ